ncbi:nuclear transport factor 2 family protein [Flavobacterium sp. LB1P71]|uniref:nuclear transport factor 2 family protein n=2 Tax=Flavobacterium TaxID=237 RepID=UPI003AB01161
MKKFFSIALLIATCITFAQKKTNGTIYVEHPAITAVEAMTQAYVNGDADKVASFLADDFNSHNGTSSNKDDKGSDKASFLNEVKFWKDNVDYLSIKRSLGAYPDALEYKEDNNKDVVWVQTWEELKGVHSKTGVKIDMPLHRLFVVDKNNKIKTIIKYANNSIFDEIGSSFNDRENGVIYNHHENINIVRKMIYAFENKDFDKAYSFYDEKATFMDINSPVGKSITLAEQKANDQKLFDKFDLTSIDMVGYPDYLHYEMGDAMAVQSWWNFRLTRKSDKKKIVLPIFFIDNFNDKGKITSEIAYYSEKLME